MPKYRKRPIVIEAVQYTGPDDLNGARDWVYEGGGTVSTAGWPFDILTLEGAMHVDTGDWVICGVKGEFYPCKPDIFERTYEAVDE